MKVFVQIHNDEIVQVADGFVEAPFADAIEVPEDVAKAVAAAPEDWKYINGIFTHLPREKVPIARPDDDVLNLKSQVATLKNRLAQKDQEVAAILLELAQLRGGTP